MNDIQQQFRILRVFRGFFCDIIATIIQKKANLSVFSYNFDLHYTNLTARLFK